MKGRVVELIDENTISEYDDNEKEGTLSPSVIEIGSMIAGDIENSLVSLASMEHRWKEMEEKKTTNREVVEGAIETKDSER